MHRDRRSVIRRGENSRKDYVSLSLAPEFGPRKRYTNSAAPLVRRRNRKRYRRLRIANITCPDVGEVPRVALHRKATTLKPAR